MKYWTYIYGRTYERDFRTICSPPSEIVNVDNLNAIEDFAREVLNTDRGSNGRIDPAINRYAFKCFERFVVWGVGFSHEASSFQQFGLGEYVHDKKRKTTSLRSFVGMIIEKTSFEQTDRIPYSEEVFYRLFKKYVVPYWNWPEFKSWKPIVSEKEDSSIFCPSDEMALMGKCQYNNDADFCSFFPQISLKEILSSMKSCRTNFITGLNVESHVESAANARPPVYINNAICGDTMAFHKERIKPIVSSHTTPETSQDASQSSTTFKQRAKSILSNIFSSDKKQQQSSDSDAETETVSTSDITGVLSDLPETRGDVDLRQSEGRQMTEDLLQWGDSWNKSEDSSIESVSPETHADLKEFDLLPQIESASIPISEKEEKLNQQVQRLVELCGIDEALNQVELLLGRIEK